MSNGKIVVNERQLKQLLNELRPQYVVDAVQGRIEGEREGQPPESLSNEISTGGNFKVQYLRFASPQEEKVDTLRSKQEDASLYENAIAYVTSLRRKLAGPTKFLIPAAWTGIDVWIADIVAGDPALTALTVERAATDKGLPDTINIEVLGSLITAVGPHIVIHTRAINNIANYVAKALSTPVTPANVDDIKTLCLFLAGKKAGMDAVFGTGWWEGHFNNLAKLAKKIDPSLPFDTSSLLKSGGLALVCSDGTSFYDGIDYFRHLMTKKAVLIQTYKEIIDPSTNTGMSAYWTKNRKITVPVKKSIKDQTFEDLLARVERNIKAQIQQLRNAMEKHPDFVPLYEFLINRNDEAITAFTGLTDVLEVTRMDGRTPSLNKLVIPTIRRGILKEYIQNKSTFKNVVKLLTEQINPQISTGELMVGNPETDTWIADIGNSQAYTNASGVSLLTSITDPLDPGVSKFIIFGANGDKKDEVIYQSGNATTEAGRAFVKLLSNNTGGEPLMKSLRYDVNNSYVNDGDKKPDNITALWWLPDSTEFAFYIQINELGDMINPFESGSSYINPLLSALEEYIENQSIELGANSESDQGLYSIHLGYSDGTYELSKQEVESHETAEESESVVSGTTAAAAAGSGTSSSSSSVINSVKKVEQLVNKYISAHGLNSNIIMTVDGKWKAEDDDDGWAQMVKHTLGDSGSHPAKEKGADANIVATSWVQGGPMVGYDPNINGALKFVEDAISGVGSGAGTQGVTKPGKKSTRQTTRKPGNIRIDVQGKLLNNPKIDQFKEEIKQAVYGSMPTGKIVDHDFTIKIRTGTGGRVKNVSQLPAAYDNKFFKKHIKDIIKGPSGVNTRGTIIVTVPRGDYTMLTEAQQFIDILRHTLRK